MDKITPHGTILVENDEVNDSRTPLPYSPLKAREKRTKPQFAESAENPSTKPDENYEEKQVEILGTAFSDQKKFKTNEPSTSVVAEEVATIKANFLSKGKAIGKIQLPKGLAINPFTLLPGSKPPLKKKPTAIEQASGSSARKIATVAFKGQGSVAVTTSHTASPSSSTIDDEIFLPTLNSVIKGRARIQVERKPQSRRARHEAIRSQALREEADRAATSPKEGSTPTRGI